MTVKLEIFPGAFHLRQYLSAQEQITLIARCKQVGAQPAGFYTPAVRNGAYMRIQMVCLGLHWNARTYKYGPTRSDYDDLPVQAIPDEWRVMAVQVARECGMEIAPDICLLNHYPQSGRLGLHQDKDERPETIRQGIPIVSISLGDTAKFLIGGNRRKDLVNKLDLESGDALVMGNSSRLRYHGVGGIIAGTAPPDLGITGRFNLTFRQY
ncbi:MAG TPA: alpha-ketoglutarate-dependent dioxygenase AlkB [Blastocatellia bacterium]|nr:alpha-ketoglutarate-dependent dioxygenase AlkB [Blastocatellia bacterium]